MTPGELDARYDPTDSDRNMRLAHAALELTALCGRAITNMRLHITEEEEMYEAVVKVNTILDEGG